MKYIFLFLFAPLVVSLGQKAETSEYSFEDYMGREYRVTDKNILPLTYYIVASKPQTLEEGFSYLRTGREETFSRSKVFSIMGRLLSAYPTDEYDADIKTYVEGVESSYSHYSEVIDTYTTLAKIGTKQTLKMLQERATYEFWEGREMPALIVSDEDHPHDHFDDNAQSTAISRLGRHSSPQAKAFLEELWENPRYVYDPILKINESFRMGMESATKEAIAHRQKQIDDALAMKKSIFGSEASVEITEDSVTEISGTAPDVKQAAEAVSEPAIEEPVEVATFEPSEVAIEKSSNWLLWLIGVIVVVGGIGLAVRRKN